MRETKRRMEVYSFYDRTGLERHLARMAEKGWLLEKIGQFFWTYRRAEPKTLTFSVCYFPKASQFDPEPSEEQQTFYDFCQHTGWTLAASSAQLQVFYNQRPHPVPIETDPVVEVDAIHRTMKRSFLPSQLVLLAATLMNSALLVWRFWTDPIGVLSGPGNLFSGMCWVMVALLVGVELGSYFRWHSKAVPAAERGEFVETHSHRKLQAACIVLLVLGLAYYLLSVFTSGNRTMMTIMALTFLLYLPGVFLVINGLKRFMKHMKAPTGVNRAVTLVGSFVLMCAILGVIIFGTLAAYRHGWLYESQETYEYNGRAYTIRRDRIPLTLDDLLDGNFDHYSRERFGEQSFLLGQYTIHQWPIGPVELFPEEVYLSYEITLVKAQLLYDLCRETKLHERDYWNDDELDGRPYYCYQPADPAPWGAVEAYRWMRGGVPSNQFLLLYPERIVEINMDWDGEPTQAQMALAGEKLGG